MKAHQKVLLTMVTGIVLFLAIICITSESINKGIHYIAEIILDKINTTTKF